MDLNKVKSFLSSGKTVIRSINGQDFEFHPLKVKILKEIKEFADPLSQAITLFNNSTPYDTETVTKLGKDQQIQEHVSKAIAPELAAIRMNERKAATSHIVSILSQEGTRSLLAKAILNSLQVEVPKQTVELNAFIEEMDFNTLTEFISGIIEVHKESFVPLVNTVTNLFPKIEET